MGFFNRLFGKKKPPRDDAAVDLAFVLLSSEQLPSAEEIVRCYRQIDPGGDDICESEGDGDKSSSDEVLLLPFESKETAFVALMPVAVPNGEAEEGAQFSVSSLGGRWTLPQHCAHLLVTLPSAGRLSPVERLSRFTSLLAAVVQASDCVGVYWGNAGATHEPEFFISAAREVGVVPRIMLWTGVSIAQEKDGRHSLLSLGMKQLDLPDLLLVVSESSRSSAIETFFDLLAYTANRGEPLPEGDTVGRTAEEKLPVHYVPSPVDSSKKVWRVEVA
ncbi:MAG: DUF4261 domain-containing protein [Pirellulaceae bacterium]